MKPLTVWALKFYVRHPIIMAKHHWMQRGTLYQPVTVGELYPLVEQLMDALDEQKSRSEHVRTR